MRDGGPLVMGRPDEGLVGIRAGAGTLGALVQALPNLVWIADARGRIEYANALWVEYTGYTVEGLSAERGLPRGIVHPDDLDRTWEAWERALRTGELYEVSYRLRCAQDGSYRWFIARAVPVMDETGAITQWVGCATDIDAQVRASAGSRFFAEAAVLLSSSLEREAITAQFVRLAVRLFCDCCIVLLRDEDGSLRAVDAAHNDPDLEARVREASRSVRLLPEGPVEQVLQSKQPLLIRDVPDQAVREGALADEQRRLTATMRIRSAMVAPLIVAGSLIGVVSFISSDAARVYDEADLAIAAATARQAALALENARAFERERTATERFRFLARVTEELFTSLDAGVTLQRLLEAVVGERADWAAALRLQPRGGLRVEAVAHRDPRQAPLAQRLVRQRPLVPEFERRIVRQIGRHRAHTVSDIDAMALAVTVQPHLLETFLRLSPQTAVFVPLFVGDALYGALVAYSNNPGHNYAEEDLELLEEIGRRASLTLEHARSFERERHLARTLQEATLPPQLPSIPGALLSTAYAPAAMEAQVGGDWYDAFELGEDRVLITIGDVTGHGLHASVVMSKLRHFFNVIATYESDPARILDAAERILLQRYPNAIATAFLAILDLRSESLVYANAGHPYPLALLHSGEIIALEAHGLPMGLRSSAEPGPSVTRTIRDVSLLAFYTDGLTEATRDIEQGERRLRAALSKEAVQFTRSAATYITASCLPAKSRDDVAVLVLGFTGSSVWTFDADDATSAHNARKSFTEQLRQHGSPDSDFAAAELIFGELVGNVVRHAPGPIDIALEWRKATPMLHVVDRGSGFAPSRPQLVDPLREDGRGLWLVQLLGRGLRVERLPYFGNHVRVALPVERRA